MDAKEHEWERRGGSRMKRRFALRRYDTLVVLFGGNGF
jgi:predicted nucleotidyltransferase